MATEASYPLLGDPLPPFVAPSQRGESIDYTSFSSGSWLMLFSLPADFTPVCSTELAMVAKLMPEFDRRGCKVLGLAVDDVSSHAKWISDISEAEGVTISFPVLADESGVIAKQLGMLHPSAEGTGSGKFTIRAVHLVDPAGVLQLSMMYPTTTGRNFTEILRCLDSLQLAAKHKIGTPANWRPGEDVVILPSVDDEEAARTFPKGFTSIKPYLRITATPDD